MKRKILFCLTLILLTLLAIGIYKYQAQDITYLEDSRLYYERNKEKNLTVYKMPYCGETEDPKIVKNNLLITEVEVPILNGNAFACPFPVYSFPTDIPLKHNSLIYQVYTLQDGERLYFPKQKK